MSNEITVNSRLRTSKGTTVIDRQVSPSSDMSGVHYSDNIQSIPTTAAGTAITITAGVGSNVGQSLFQNLESPGGNFVDIGVQVSGTFYPLFRMYPGEASGGRLATSAPYARANGAAVNLMALVLES